MSPKLFLVSLSLVLLVASCGNDTANSESTSANASSSNDTAANTASAPTQDTSSQSPSSNVQSGGIDDAMQRMMQDMHSMKMTEDADHDFAMMMKRHHDGAIEMSKIEMSQGKSPELKQIAQKIIDDSQKDNTQLESFLAEHKPSSKSDFAKKSMDMMMKQPADSSMKSSGDLDKHFAKLMAKHHQGGIDMAKLYLKSGKDQKIKAVANNVIKANSADLKTLQSMASTH